MKSLWNRNVPILLSLLLFLMVLHPVSALARQQKFKSVKITDMEISKIVNKEYTGKKQTQRPVIMNGSYKLKRNTDYTLSYKKNIEIGTASVTIKGKGMYSGSVIRTFQINPAKTVLINDGQPQEKIDSIDVKVGNTTFTAMLEENDTTKAFIAQLPLKIKMSELNGNEKYSFLSGDLRTDTASSPGTINEGDLMLYGDNCLVLFYETFHTSYSYVKLGHIDNTTGLAKAVGSDRVQVTFSVSD